MSDNSPIESIRQAISEGHAENRDVLACFDHISGLEARQMYLSKVVNDWVALGEQQDKVIKLLTDALEEAICWLPLKEGLTPGQRGAGCETLTGVLAMAEAALCMAKQAGK